MWVWFSVVFCLFQPVWSRIHSYLKTELIPACLYYWQIPYSSGHLPVQSWNRLSTPVFFCWFRVTVVRFLAGRVLECLFQHYRGNYGKLWRQLQSFFPLVALGLSFILVRCPRLGILHWRCRKAGWYFACPIFHPTQWPIYKAKLRQS